MDIFNRKLLNIRYKNYAPLHEKANFLKKEIASSLIDRLNEIKTPFTKILDVGCGLGEVADCLNGYNNNSFELLQIDESMELLNYNHHTNTKICNLENINLEKNHFNLITSVLSLHNVNNLDKVLRDIYSLLKPNGALLLSIPIVGTLNELETALMKTEIEMYKGVSPRVHPFVDMVSLGDLLQKAQFKNIVIDKDKLSIMYKDPYSLFKDLKHSSQNNILNARSKKFVNKNFFKKVIEHLEEFIDEKSKCYQISVIYANVIAWRE